MWCNWCGYPGNFNEVFALRGSNNTTVEHANLCTGDQSQEPGGTGLGILFLETSCPKGKSLINLKHCDSAIVVQCSQWWKFLPWWSLQNLIYFSTKGIAQSSLHSQYFIDKRKWCIKRVRNRLQAGSCRAATRMLLSSLSASLWLFSAALKAVANLTKNKRRKPTCNAVKD